MSSLRKSFALVALLLVPACSVADFYDDKEYVLYDSDPPAAQGSPERAAADRLAASVDAANLSAADAELERLFVLENLRDELARAVTDGVGDAATLERKRADVEREIAWRRAEAGEAYTKLRAVRIERLQAFPVVIR